MIFVIGFLGYYRSTSGYNVELTQVFDRVMHELSIAQNNLYIVLSIFPEEHSYMYGAGFFSALLTLLPGKQYLIDWYIKDLSCLEFEGGGLPPTLLGLFYIDFSFIGVFIFAVVLGYMLMKTYTYAIRKNSALTYIVFAFFLELLLSGIRNILIPEIFIMYTILIFGALYFLSVKSR